MVAFIKSILPLALLFTTTLASPITLATRQSAVDCAGVSYSSDDTYNCANAAYNSYLNGGRTGGSKYPERFNNYEGFPFAVDGPYLEFPLFQGSAYTGGPPGADRCVINTNGDYAGTLTHHGASGNGFVGCSDTQ